MSKINKQKMVQALQNFWSSTFLTSCLLCLFLGVANTAIAEYKKPPGTHNDAPKEESTTMTGIRGKGSCSEQAITRFTALAPYSHSGQSANSHPTFAWHIPDPESYPVFFRLYEYDATQRNGKGKTIAKKTLSSTSGIMTYVLPSDSPGLTAGQKYIWQAILVCNPNSPSESLVTGARINIVNPPSGIITQSNNTSEANPAAKADIYAQAGLWYDALAEVVSIPNQAVTTKLIRQLAALEGQNYANELEKIIKASIVSGN
ncbi:MAG: hypothetical protein RLZZ381_4 [Cyanobacteriota bacterium]|jgi:hypothetical protein